MKGIIYYNENRGQAIEIFERMIERYKMMEIPVEYSSIGKSYYSIAPNARFGNGDTWTVCRACDSARGYKCNVAYIERSIPHDMYCSIIMPAMIEYPFCAIHLWGEGDLHLDYTPNLPF